MLICGRIDYYKKPGKLATVKTVKDPAVPRDDTYKSGTIHTGPGEPPNSVSKPTPRHKPVAARPVTKGKLLRPGGPGGAPSKLRPNGTASRTVPQATRRPTATATARATPTSQPIAAAVASQISNGSARAPPPPPPPSGPPAPKKPMAKALYDFTSERANELTIHAGELLQIVSKEGNGKLDICPSFPDIVVSQASFYAGRWLIQTNRLVALYEYHDVGAGMDARVVPGRTGGCHGSTSTASTAASSPCSTESSRRGQRDYTGGGTSEADATSASRQKTHGGA
jgi:hypothetical protein